MSRQGTGNDSRGDLTHIPIGVNHDWTESGGSVGAASSHGSLVLDNQTVRRSRDAKEQGRDDLHLALHLAVPICAIPRDTISRPEMADSEISHHFLSAEIGYLPPVCPPGHAQRGKRFPLSSLPNLKSVSTRFVPPGERGTLIGRSVYVHLSGLAWREKTNGEPGKCFPLRSPLSSL